MSTTIEIISVETNEITFREVIDLSEKYIESFLKSIGVKKKINLEVNIHDINEKYIVNVNLSDKFEWKKNEYAWFTIKGIDGGTAAYCELVSDMKMNPKNPWWRLDYLKEENKIINNIDIKIEKIKKLNTMWYFRRSAGQSAIINISYGTISASIAELTSGILFSDDGAWDYECFPTESNQFLEFYFRPEKAISNDNAKWAKRCIDAIKTLYS